MNEPELPLPEGKTSFKPEELYRFTKVKPFVLSFWESEFPSLAPKKTGSEGLAYSRADVEMILAIKRLLYDEGLTLAEARRQLSGDEDQEAKKKAGSTGGTKRKKKKKVTVKPVTTSSGGGKGRMEKATDAGTTALPKPGKARGKRGLPGAEAARTAVSLEDLLPNSAGSEPAVTDEILLPDPPGRKSVAAAEKGKSRKMEVARDQQELRGKLTSALAQLREILTFLDKGDR